jgi:hypothetical protein
MEKIIELLNSINDATISGDIIWIERISMFTTDTQKYFTYESEDKLTNFDIKISIDNDLKSLLYGSCMLTIKNKDLIDESMYIYSNKNKELKQLVDFIFNTKIKNNFSTKDQDKVLENILGSIGNKSSRRDKKIDDILNNETDKEVSLWRRIFKKHVTS